MISTSSIQGQYWDLAAGRVWTKSSVASPVAPTRNDAANVTISDAGYSAEAEWQKIANKYDVTNISTNERAAMAQELSDNHLVSNDVLLFMVAPLSMNENRDQKVNYLSMMRESFEVASNMGVSGKQLELQKERLSILERLNNLSNGA